jgi:hypothetical protein
MHMDIYNLIEAYILYISLVVSLVYESCVDHKIYARLEGTGFYNRDILFRNQGYMHIYKLRKQRNWER